jgi:hypothetical protein
LSGAFQNEPVGVENRGERRPIKLRLAEESVVFLISWEKRQRER